ncbi:MAG: PASTA domain-containing protein [Flavobacteriales bacterium]|nr:PASTA domain-containing protein [Flavobacteriales bacterium]
MYVNKKLDIELSGEGTPKIKNTTDKTWSGITLPWMSIGYELELTPLNILTFYNAVANNGKMVKPKFVKEIRYRGKLVRTIETEVLNPSICSQKTIAMAKEMLEAVVEEGTARNLKNDTYKIAGKTGTAQIANKKLGYKYKGDIKVSHQASFVGYFPADNPKYSCIVVVNAPSKGVYYGNLVAGPIFKEVDDKVYAPSLGIHKEIVKTENIALSRIPYAKDGNYDDLKMIYNHFGIKTKINNSVDEWAKISTGVDEVTISSRKIAPIYVADVVGMSIKDALYILENQGLRVVFVGKGTVKNQSIISGSKL